MKKNKLLYFFIFLFFLLLISKVYSSESGLEDKKFKWGVGTLSIYGNHYRGSDQEKFWLFPLPYFTYKSEKIEADPSFVRGVIFHNDWFSFKLSLMLGLNTESRSNRAREGMPSLDYTIEAGPMFIFHLFKSRSEKNLINFEWPIRESFVLNIHNFRSIGFITIPYLNFIQNPTPSNWNWSSEFSISPMFASKNYHQYYYGVDQKFTREDRSFYQAIGGYSGFQTGIILNKRFKQLVLIPFARWDYLKHSVFENSPLVKKKNYLISGLGIFWLFN